MKADVVSFFDSGISEKMGKLSIFFFLSMASSFALALDELPTVTVTAEMEKDSAFSPSLDAAQKALEETAGGVTLVPAEQFLSGRAGTMEDSLKLAAGVFIASRFGSDEARISIRGSGLQRTFHGRGLTLLQDGTPVNLADGSFDMQAVEPQATRYISIERGANALRYGAGTLGGAINYISETGRSSPALSFRAEGGSGDYQRYNISTGGQSGRVDGFASFNYVGQHGFRQHSEQDNWRFFSNAGIQLTEAIESRLYITVVDSQSELPGNLTYAQLKADPRQANSRAIARDQQRDYTLYRVADRNLITHDDGASTEVSMFYAQKNLYHPIEFFPTGPGLIEQDSQDWGVGLRYNRETQWFGQSQSHVTGIKWHHGITLDERYTYANNVFVPSIGFAVGNQPGTLDNRQQQTADNVSIYGQSLWKLTNGTTLVTGLQSVRAKRRQMVQVDNTGFDPVTGAVCLPTASYEETWQRILPYIGFIYHAEAFDVYGNMGGSFESPSFSETLNNKPLRAQRALTHELGIRHNAQYQDIKLGWDVSVYHADIHNELLEIVLNAGTPATANADKTVHQGVEATLSLETSRWRVQGSYLWNDFRFHHDAVFGNNRIAGLPSQVLGLEVAFRLSNQIWLGPTVQAASHSWVDHANTTKAPGYSIYGLKVGQKLIGNISWFLEGRNLTNKNYVATTGVVRDMSSLGVNQAQFNPGDGRSVFMGISKQL